MIQREEHVRRLLTDVAQRGATGARLFRRSGLEGEEEATGAFVLFTQRNGLLEMNIRGIQGELPANIRITDGDVFVSSAEQPEAWQAADEEGDGFRVFTLLDPRRLARHMKRVQIRVAGAKTRVVGHVDLSEWEPKLPDGLLTWLGSSGRDRVINVLLEEERLLEVVQPDLPPRLADFIVEKFLQPNLELLETKVKPSSSSETAEERFLIPW